MRYTVFLRYTASKLVILFIWIVGLVPTRLFVNAEDPVVHDTTPVKYDNPLLILAGHSNPTCKTEESLEDLFVGVTTLPVGSQLSNPMQLGRRIAPEHMIIEALHTTYAIWDQWGRSLMLPRGCGGLEAIARMLELRKILSELPMDSFITGNVPKDSRYLYATMKCPMEHPIKLKSFNYEWESIRMFSRLLTEIKSLSDSEIQERIGKLHKVFSKEVVALYEEMKYNNEILSGNRDEYSAEKLSVNKKIYEENYAQCRRRDMLIAIQHLAKLSKRIATVFSALPLLLPMRGDPVSQQLAVHLNLQLDSSKAFDMENIFKGESFSDGSRDTQETKKVLGYLEKLRYDLSTSIDYRYLLVDEQEALTNIILWKKARIEHYRV